MSCSMLHTAPAVPGCCKQSNMERIRSGFNRISKCTITKIWAHFMSEITIFGCSGGEADMLATKMFNSWRSLVSYLDNIKIYYTNKFVCWQNCSLNAKCSKLYPRIWLIRRTLECITLFRRPMKLFTANICPERPRKGPAPLFRQPRMINCTTHALQS